jgi:hypothetical protein
MPRRKTKPREIEFRLDPDAITRIKANMENCKLNCIKEYEYKSKGKKWKEWAIAYKAENILKARGLSEIHTINDDTIKGFLNGKIGKSHEVFKSLCEAVEEDWLKVYEKETYMKLIEPEQKQLRRFFMDQILFIFSHSPQDEKILLDIYRERIEMIIISSSLEEYVITDFLSDLINEYAHNGRQIKIEIPNSREYPLIELKIIGINQRDETVSYPTTTRYDRDLQYAETQGWWWKGDTKIKYRLLDNNEEIEKTCSVCIPESGYIWVHLILDLEQNICHIK